MSPQSYCYILLYSMLLSGVASCSNGIDDSSRSGSATKRSRASIDCMAKRARPPASSIEEAISREVQIPRTVQSDQYVLSLDIGSSLEKEYIGPDYKEIFSKQLTPACIQELRQGAERNDAFALCVLGILYERGLYDFRQNFTEATTLFEWAAQLGEAEAQYRMGEFYQYGIVSRKGLRGWGIALGILRDPTSGSFWYEKAAKQGHILAQYNMGLLYAKLFIAKRRAPPLPQEVEKAIYWFTLAAKQGLKEAQKLLPTRALLAVAQQDNPQSLPGQVEYLLGKRYAIGFRLPYTDEQDVEKDPVSAKHWLESAAAARYKGALFALGQIAEAEEAGLTVEEAVGFYTQAIEKDKDVRALKQLGIIYQEGKGRVTQDEVRALDCFRKAYAADAFSIDKDLLYRFGCLLDAHPTCDADQQQALKHLKRALEFQGIESKALEREVRDFPDLEYRLGRMYEEGRGTQQDNAQAVSHYKIAALHGFKEARERLDTLIPDVPELIGLEKRQSTMSRWIRWIPGMRGEGDRGVFSGAAAQKRVASDPALDTPVPKRPRTGGSRAGPALPASSVESENTSDEENA